MIRYLLSLCARELTLADILRSNRRRKVKPLLIDLLPIDSRGSWSRSQVQRVIDANAPAAAAQGLTAVKVDITTFTDATRWYQIHYQCTRHQLPVNLDMACNGCLHE